VEMDSASFEPPRWGVLSLSVLGSLAGWGLMIYAVLGGLYPWIYLVLAGGLGLHWLWDVTSRRALPAWYDGLRSLATAGTLGAMVFAYAVTAWPG